MADGNQLDKWRDYFRSCNSDIFDIIEHGILVAASDCPKEFRLRRDRIAQTLFSCKYTKCVGCDRVQLSVPGAKTDEDFKIGGAFEFESGGGMSKESKVCSGRDDHDNDQMLLSHYSYGDAQALTDEIEKESQIVGEVFRIKEILEDDENESISSLIDSLRRLELMALSVEILKATEIGKAVNALRKHASKDIRHLARTLIEGWKMLVDEWVNATAAVPGASEGGTPESMNPSSVVDEENGLPSPPLDDLSFFATQPSTMELSGFFDGLEDDENPGHSVKFNEKHETDRRQPVESHKIVKQKSRFAIESSTPPKDKKDERTRKPDVSVNKQVTPLLKPNKLSITETRPPRPTKPCLDHKVHNETKLQQKSETVAIQRAPVSEENKPRCLDEVSVQAKLEATKRRLQERYQQAENAKKQRTIQVMELHDLPKQGVGLKNPLTRPGNTHKRNWAHGRR